MRRLTTSLMIATATVVVAAGSASAQTLKADIPFTFRTANGLMLPGSYELRTDEFPGFVVLRNRDTGDGGVARIVPGDPAKEVKAGGIPMLRLRCTESRCVLLDLWTGSESAYHFLPPKSARGEASRIAEIRLSPGKAD